MKDPSISDHEAEQKKFSFDMLPTKQHRETADDSELRPSGDQYIGPDVVADGADDVLSATCQEHEQRDLPGVVLCAERKRRGFTIKEIASQLFLTETQITALEKDNYDCFPAPIFVTGYIRNYARLLDLPPDPLVELFNAQGPQVEPKLNRVSRTGSSIKDNIVPFDLRVTGAVVVVVLLILLLWQMSADEELVVQDEVVGSEGDSAAPFFASDSQVEAVEVVSTPLVTLSVAEVKETVAQDEEVVAAVDTGTEIETPPASEFMAERAVTGALPDSLELTFTAESWIEITDANGRRVMFGLGKPGQRRVLSGIAPFNILLGNSAAVTMTYNGESFDQRRFARGKVAKFTLGEPAE